MLALIEVTCQVNNHTPKDLFRTAYMWRFQKDMPPNSLSDDVQEFQGQHKKIPPYVIDYMLDYVQRHSH